ncbi:hypothetical protein V6N11_081332 [Hibiscus sabdariffa]|uniref:Uncharacterized protein n=1 Tax=Hibiscus sabdariffa TaxID=183260 RepID=A0ABR2QJK8_9ROSI
MAGMEKESNDWVEKDACEIDIKQLSLDNQRQRRPSSRQCCIYRAHVVRDVDTATFTPKIVSIGPLHHSQPHLKSMKETKIKYLEQFLRHAANTARLHEQNHLVNNLKENNIEEASNCFSSEEFLRLVLVDVAFIIELFLRYHFCSPHFDLWAIMLPPFYQFILNRSDLWLLENQLPYFVLENLYVTAFGSYPQIYPPFLELTFKIFEFYNQWEMKPEAVEGKGLKHFTDLIRAFFLRQLGNYEEQHSNENIIFPLCDHLPSETQLHDAGIEFVETQGKSLVDINFFKSSGSIYGMKQRNVSATSSPWSNITIHVKLTIGLEAAAKWPACLTVFALYILKGRINPHFFKIIEQLNRYHSRRLNRWKATLRQQYFSSPFRAASTIGGIILLVLTLVQTILAGLDLKSGP